jgi:hypothetical protein
VDFTDAIWRRSSFSTGEGDNANCVEIAGLTSEFGVRDSKNPARELTFTGLAWRAFTTRLGA